MDAQVRNDDRTAVARRLRQVRVDRGVSIEEVGRAINVDTRHLKTLEDGDLAALPSPLWARWILIRYANHLGLEGDRLADELLPLQRPSLLGSASRPMRRLGRYRWALLASSGAVVFSAMVTAATILAPYNAVTGWVSGFLHGIAPGTFLGDEPFRVVVLGDAETGIAGGDNVLIAKVAEDGIGLLSLPRNTVTEIPGHGRGRVGDAFSLGGPDLARRSVAQLADTEVPRYCVVGAEGIRNIVDSMGGVRVDVRGPLRGRPAPGEPVVTLRAGRQTLNGDQALVYLQGRDLPDGAQRAGRQQNFLYTMFGQTLEPSNLLARPASLGTLLDNVETDMSGVQVVQLAGRARALKDAGAPVETGSVPGQQERVPTGTEDTPVDTWVPDAQRLLGVLKDTVR